MMGLNDIVTPEDAENIYKLIQSNAGPPVNGPPPDSLIRPPMGHMSLDKYLQSLYRSWEGINWRQSQIFEKDITERGKWIDRLFPVVDWRIAKQMYPDQLVNENGDVFDVHSAWTMNKIVYGDKVQGVPATVYEQQQREGQTRCFGYKGGGFALPMYFALQATQTLIADRYVENMSGNIFKTIEYEVLSGIMDESIKAQCLRWSKQYNSVSLEDLNKFIDTLKGLSYAYHKNEGYQHVEDWAFEDFANRGLVPDLLLTGSTVLKSIYLHDPKRNEYASAGDRQIDKAESQLDPEGRSRTPIHKLKVLASFPFLLGTDKRVDNPIKIAHRAGLFYVMEHGPAHWSLGPEKYTHEARSIQVVDIAEKKYTMLEFCKAVRKDGIFHPDTGDLDDTGRHGIMLLTKLWDPKAKNRVTGGAGSSVLMTGNLRNSRAGAVNATPGYQWTTGWSREASDRVASKTGFGQCLAKPDWNAREINPFDNLPAAANMFTLYEVMGWTSRIPAYFRALSDVDIDCWESIIDEQTVAPIRKTGRHTRTVKRVHSTTTTLPPATVTSVWLYPPIEKPVGKKGSDIVPIESAGQRFTFEEQCDDIDTYRSFMNLLARMVEQVRGGETFDDAVKNNLDSSNRIGVIRQNDAKLLGENLKLYYAIKSSDGIVDPINGFPDNGRDAATYRNLNGLYVDALKRYSDIGSDSVGTARYSNIPTLIMIPAEILNSVHGIDLVNVSRGVADSVARLDLLASWVLSRTICLSSSDRVSPNQVRLVGTFVFKAIQHLYGSLSSASSAFKGAVDTVLDHIAQRRVNVAVRLIIDSAAREDEAYADPILYEELYGSVSANNKNCSDASDQEILRRLQRTRISAKFREFVLNRNIPWPMNYLLLQPDITMTSIATVVMKSGPKSALVAYKDPIINWTPQTGIAIISVECSLKLKFIPLEFENFLFIPNAGVTDYHSGGGTGFRSYTNPLRHGVKPPRDHGLYVVPITEPVLGGRIWTPGYIHPELVTEAENEIQYQTAEFAAKRYGFANRIHFMSPQYYPPDPQGQRLIEDVAPPNVMCDRASWKEFSGIVNGNLSFNNLKDGDNGMGFTITPQTARCLHGKQDLFVQSLGGGSIQNAIQNLA